MAAPKISAAHRQELREAKAALENTSMAMQFANVLGSPIETLVTGLPESWQAGIVGLTREALEKATDIAISTLTAPAKPAKAGPGAGLPLPSNAMLHRLAVSLTGAAGGAFGLPALAIELPISTTIMLRSIADIARGEGEDLADPATKLACIEVFALGGRSGSDDAAESAYYLSRAGLAKVVSEAVEYLARGGAEAAAPAIAVVIARVASRFQIQVTEKAAAQAAPLVGAAGGALLNNLFIGHFQSVARGHFTVRRLERIYTPELIEAAYRRL